MVSRLKHISETIRVAFWPLPAAIALACYLVAEVSLRLDEELLLPGFSWTAETSAEGLRSLLSTAASGAITLAALVFSTTLVALTLASSQFGPRLLHNFIRARSN